MTRLDTPLSDQEKAALMLRMLREHRPGGIDIDSELSVIDSVTSAMTEAQLDERAMPGVGMTLREYREQVRWLAEAKQSVVEFATALVLGAGLEVGP